MKTPFACVSCPKLGVSGVTPVCRSGGHGCPEPAEGKEEEKRRRLFKKASKLKLKGGAK